jgi:hypothetical protein
MGTRAAAAEMGGGVVTHQSNINLYYSPQPAAPHLQQSSAWQLAGPVHENGQPRTTQPVHCVQKHSLSGTISLRLQDIYMSATSQSRLNGVLVKRLGMKCF